MTAHMTTLPGTPMVSAPGKLMLIGEYGVLEGGRAVVTAVDRLAVGQFVPGRPHPSPLVAECLREASRLLGERAQALPSGSVEVDTEAFRHDGRKLGIGSSAATAAVSVGAALELAGLPVANERPAVFRAAARAHRAAQAAAGSGADVAACVYGGTIQYQRPEGGSPVVMPLLMPSALVVVAFATGAEADTSTLVRTVLAHREANAAAHDILIDKLRQAADRFIRACETETIPTVFQAVRQHADALAELGAAVGAPLMTPTFRRAVVLAAALGGAAKPSGAGAGDLGVAFFAEPAAAATFSTRAAAEGMPTIKLTLGAPGLRRYQYTP